MKILKHLKRVLILLLVLLIILLPLSIVLLKHDCMGEDCLFCNHINQFDTVLKNTALFLSEISLLLLLIALFYKLASANKNKGIYPNNLYSMKVRMNR